MLFTRNDPRDAWRSFVLGQRGPEVEAELVKLPTGARETPLSWLGAVEEEAYGSFDRDRQEAVEHTRRILAGWHATPDPRIRLAGSLSLHGIDLVRHGVISTWPGAEALGAPGLRVLSMPAPEFGGYAADVLRRGSTWDDLIVWGCFRWARSACAAALEVVARDWSLRGLALHGGRLEAPTVKALASAAWWPSLEDLSLDSGWLGGEVDLFLGRLDGPRSLDLHGLCIPGERLVAHARVFARATYVVLSGNPLGTHGAALLSQLAEVEDLRVEACGLDDRAVDALIDLDPPGLRGLWLADNPLTEAAIVRLMASPLGERLQGLSLPPASSLGPAARAALEGHLLEGALGSTVRAPGVRAVWLPGRA